MTVAESDLTMMVCVTMATIPLGGTISEEVVVSLSTVDGTGTFANLLDASVTIVASYMTFWA